MLAVYFSYISVYTVAAKIRLKTPPSVDKEFHITDDVACIVSEATCSFNVEFTCENKEALEDLSFKNQVHVLEEWLNEQQFVWKLSDNATFSGCQPVVDIDEDSREYT